MQHISLFSGIGGFDLPAEWMGWENIASCEINPFGNKVLNHYWPNAYHHDDIKTLTYKKLDEELTKRYGTCWRTNDIVLTGGFPCQDASIAKQSGSKSKQGLQGERTGLFYEMCRVIREIRPKFIVAENVKNILKTNNGTDFSTILTELSRMGYNAEWKVCRASDIGSVHHRARLYIVAYPMHIRLQKGQTFFPNVQKTSSQISWEFAGTTIQTFRANSWTSEPPAICVDDGVSFELPKWGFTKSEFKKEQIMGYGNTIVPQLAFEIFKAIDKCQKEMFANQ